MPSYAYQLPYLSTSAKHAFSLESQQESAINVAVSFQAHWTEHKRINVS